jgi:PD-(D/E)XK endonuclease
VASWFLSRGYPVSVPIEPAPYDLVTESDDGLKRVQVNSTRCTDGAGRFRVGLRRKAYDSTATANAMGKYRRTPYTAEEIDLFFVITSVGTNYLIPVGAVQGAGEIILDDKYRGYVVG